MTKYLLVAAMPTPNGGLHLGHIAAQFLPLDVFRRYQRDRGNPTAYYCGFDVFDNAVCVAARRLGMTPAAAAESFTRQIESDLAFLEIGIDRVINYADDEIQEAARGIIASLERDFGARLVSVRSRFPFGRDGQPIAGNWLRGGCPRCRRIIKGYSCDDCGCSLLPGDLLDAEAVSGEPIEWREIDVRFVVLEPRAIRDYLATIPDREAAIAAGRLEDPSLRVQWSSVDSWGLTLGGGEIFYNRNFTLVEQILIGELCRGALDLPRNAFVRGEDVTTIFAYGKDNAGLLLVDIPGLALATPTLRPYDRQWISPFYNLAGEKMSTSRGYALWVQELVGRGCSSDAVRLYLCRRFTKAEDSNLSLDELAQVTAELAQLRERAARLASGAAAPGPGTQALDDLEAALAEEIRIAMDERGPDLRVFAQVLDRWIAAAPTGEAAGAGPRWVRGCCTLMAPVLPTFCRDFSAPGPR